MATSRVRAYKDLLTSQISDIENWFQKFRYHLLEQELVIPTPADLQNPTDVENRAVEAMKKKIVIHLINSMDTEMFTKLKTLVAPNEPINETMESIEQTLIAHLAPKPTILSERHAFYLLKQKSGEDTGNYVTKLREQAIKCKFEEAQLNERIRDQFVVGISCLEAREVLLSENIDDLTLELAFQKTVAVERSRKEAQNLGMNTINQIRDSKCKSAKKHTLQCEKCGKRGHTGTSCKVRCYHCNGYGHIKSNCPERKKDKPASKSSYSKPYGGNSSRSRDNVHFKRTMNQNTYLLEDSNGESYCIGDTDTDFFDVMNVELQNLHDSNTFDNFDNNLCESKFEHDVNILNKDDLSSVCVPLEVSADVNVISSKPLVDIEINDQRFVMEIDSGASVSVCSKSALDRANINYSVRQCNTKLNVANGQKIDVLGKALVCVKVKGICKSDLELYIVDSEFPALFGRSWISEFCGNDWLDRLLSGIKCEKPVKCVTPVENLSSR